MACSRAELCGISFKDLGLRADRVMSLLDFLWVIKRTTTVFVSFPWMILRRAQPGDEIFAYRIEPCLVFEDVQYSLTEEIDVSILKIGGKFGSRISKKKFMRIGLTYNVESNMPSQKVHVKNHFFWVIINLVRGVNV